jgi:hypothetical protein
LLTLFAKSGYNPLRFVSRFRGGRKMKKVAILLVLAMAGALAGFACGGGLPEVPKDPTGTLTSASGGPAIPSAAPTGS